MIHYFKSMTRLSRSVFTCDTFNVKSHDFCLDKAYTFCVSFLIDPICFVLAGPFKLEVDNLSLPSELLTPPVARLAGLCEEVGLVRPGQVRIRDWESGRTLALKDGRCKKIITKCT